MDSHAAGGRTDADYSTHLSRIHEVVMSWHKGEISAAAKRSKIASLNAAYYGEPTVGEAGLDITTAPGTADEVAVTLAEQAQVPLPAAQAALEAWRGGTWSAEHAETLEAARAALRNGQEAYADIMRAAR